MACGSLVMSPGDSSLGCLLFVSHCVVGPLAILAGPVDENRYALDVQRVEVYLI